MNDKQLKIREMVKTLFALKGKAPDRYTIDVWTNVLIKYEVKDVANACNKSLQKSGYFEIKMLLDELTPNSRDIAISEWEKVLRVAKDGGQGHNNLSVSAKKALDSSGGLRKLQYSDSQYVVDKMRDEFIERYSRQDVVNNRLITSSADKILKSVWDNLQEDKAWEHL
jgi:hypothetical protein